ncbi:MAG: amidohydrolase family protein, partial [Candidatus Sulfotelmatobacter sp.]
TTLRVLTVAAALALAIPALSQLVPQPAPNGSVIAFQDVSVIPMDTERVLPHQTVLVRNGKIVDVGPTSSVHLPPETVVINGGGKFLMPGMADMHTHVDRKEMLPLFLAAGVTTVLNMGLASPEFVTVTRDQINRGSVVGPRVFAAFMIDGPGDPGPEYVALCERDGRAAVDRAKLVGYDFIKVYSRLQPAIYAAVLDEAKKQNIAAVGHIATEVGLENSLAQGQVMIAHGEEYYKTYFQGKPDDARIPGAVELTRRAGAYVTPNLSFFAALTMVTSDPRILDKRLAEPDIKFLPPDIWGSWLAARPAKPSDRFVPELATLKKLTLALSQAGVPLLAGTDSPAFGVIPGTSVDDDLDQLVGAGLTPFQALSAATRTPGRFIHQYVPGAEEFGTIAPGKSADLVMLRANPLLDVRNMRQPIGVMVRGHWFESRELQGLVERPVPGYKRIVALGSAFQHTLGERGATEAIREFKSHSEPSDTLPESVVNALGYRMINANRLEDAIAVFVFNTEQHPDSWNVYDSLGEAYLDSGRNDLAVVNYRRSLALNPKNTGAFEMLQKAAATTARPN